MNEIIVKNWQNILDKSVESFQLDFPDMMAANSELLKNLKLTVDVNLDLDWQQKEFKSELRSRNVSLLVSLHKDKNSSILKLVSPKQEELSSLSSHSLTDFIEEELFKIALKDTIPEIFIASTERTGATTFRKQLNLASSNLVDLLSKVHKDGEKV